VSNKVKVKTRRNL